MKSIPISDLRQRVAEVIDDVQASDEPTVVEQKTIEAPKETSKTVEESKPAEAPKYVDRPAAVNTATETPKSDAAKPAQTAKADKPKHRHYWTEARIIGELHRHGPMLHLCARCEAAHSGIFQSVY